MKKAILMILLFFFTTLSALAQYVAEASSRFEYSHMKKTYNIYFDTGVTHIDYSYRGNIDVLYGMKKDIELTLKQDNALPDSLLITATASPDGAVGYNTNLAEMRALETKRVLLLLFPDLAKSVIQIEHREITWDGVAQIIAENKNIPEATEMLGIIASDLPETLKESALKRCKWGWKYIVDNHLYVLRNSTVTIRIVMKREIPVEITEIPEEVVNSEDEPEEVSEPVAQVTEPAFVPASTYVVKEMKPSKSLLVGLKTNLFYDLAAVPNLGLEFYLGKNWSLVGNWMYAWWKSDPKAFYWRIYGGDIAIRKWFGKASHKKPLSGHHVGPYGQMLTYDFIVDEDGVLADKWSYSVGLEYGYSVPLKRRLNMDFTIGAGYHWGEYKEYVPIDGHYVWQATKRRRYLGPTKIEISLVWLIGGKDKLPEKGCAR